MTEPVNRKRRSTSRIFLILIIVAASATAVWLKYFRNPAGADESQGINPLPALERFEAIRPLMGTEFEIIVHAPGEAAANEAIEAAFIRGTAIDDACSDDDPDSDLSKLNAAPTGTPVPLSPTLTAILAHARDTADVTDGAFDPTLGTLTNLWRQSRDSGTLPAPETLGAAREASGWKHLEVDLTNSTATLSKPGMKVDLGDIAKGYAADEMLKVLQHHRISRALIRAGSDVRVGDPPPGKDGWRVDLGMSDNSMREAIVVANCAVSSSGNLHQFVDIGGTRYAHIIDPATGIGLTRRTAATIIAPTATESDPLATFACIAPDTAIQVFIGGDIRCRVITINGLDFRDRRSPNFPNIQGF
jgi:thiamine biosynthesis lipoprotein